MSDQILDDSLQFSSNTVDVKNKFEIILQTKKFSHDYKPVCLNNSNSKLVVLCTMM